MIVHRFHGRERNQLPRLVKACTVSQAMDLCQFMPVLTHVNGLWLFGTGRHWVKIACGTCRQLFLCALIRCILICLCHVPKRTTVMYLMQTNLRSFILMSLGWWECPIFMPLYWDGFLTAETDFLRSSSLCVIELHKGPLHNSYASYGALPL